MLYSIALYSLAIATRPDAHEGHHEARTHHERQAQIDTVNKAGAHWQARAHSRFADKAPGASSNHVRAQTLAQSSPLSLPCPVSLTRLTLGSRHEQLACSASRATGPSTSVST